jgi:HEAT repeat protein
MHRLSLVLAVFCLAGLGMPPRAQAQATFLNRSLPDWLRELNAPQPEVRRSAAFALGKMGGQAYVAVRPLVSRIRTDRDAGVRETAAAAVGDIVVDSGGVLRGLWTEAGPALEEALKSDPDPRVRRSAAYSLGAFGRQAVSALPVLSAALEDAHPAVRQNAAWALGRLGQQGGEAVEGLCKLLKDSDSLVRRDAAGALGTLGRPTAQAGASPLLALLRAEPDEVVRRTALDALARLAGPEQRDEADAIYPLLRDEDPETARAAAFILASMGGEQAAEALPVLRRTLTDQDPALQALAAAALARMGPAAGPAVSDLARALTSSRDRTVRRNAALALGLIGAHKARPPAEVIDLVKKEAVPALVRALKPGEPMEVREYAAEALNEIAYPVNEEALPAILEAIGKDRDPTVRQRCIWALFNVRDLEGIGADKVLAQVLDETIRIIKRRGPDPLAWPSLLVGYDAARLLAHLLRERAPEQTADVLLHMLKNDSLRVYRGTEAEVQGGSSESARARSRVKANLGGDARFMAAEALGALGARAAERDDVKKALRAAARDPEPRLRQSAEKALDRLGL